jgi:thioredoxin-like negative regulator of GroEL
MQITSGDIDQLQRLMAGGDWAAVYAMLDRVQSQATTREDKARETYWRATAFIEQGRYPAAVELLRDNVALFNSQCLPHKMIAEVLSKIGDDKGALDELSTAPIEQELKKFYGIAIDAKFLYFYLLAKTGDRSVLNRLSEIPDDYRHIAMGGKFLTKADIAALLKRV